VELRHLAEQDVKAAEQGVQVVVGPAHHGQFHGEFADLQQADAVVLGHGYLSSTEV